MRTLFAVMANSDRDEGRGSGFIVCLSESRGLALEIVKSREYASEYGVVGTPGDETDVRELQVMGSAEDFTAFVGARKRR